METPFHQGERQAQSLAGVSVSGGAIRPFMPDQHREFFAALPFIALAAGDAEGWPTGRFAGRTAGASSASPDPGRLRVAALPPADDPLAARLIAGAPIGLLGIDFASRRRNRANGTVSARDGGGFSVAIEQSFGNCPKYIHRRSVRSQAIVPARHGASTVGPTRCWGGSLVPTPCSPPARRYRARRLRHLPPRRPPRFRHPDGDSLVIPDYAGNNYFNSLGNLLLDPRAALLVPDFDRRHPGPARDHRDLWDAADAPPGARRVWRFRLRQGWLRPGVLPLRWDPLAD